MMHNPQNILTESLLELDMVPSARCFIIDLTSCKISKICLSKFLNKISSGNELWSQWIDWSNHRATFSKIVKGKNSSLLQITCLLEVWSWSVLRELSYRRHNLQKNLHGLSAMSETNSTPRLKCLMDDHFLKQKPTHMSHHLMQTLLPTNSSNLLLQEIIYNICKMFDWSSVSIINYSIGYSNQLVPGSHIVHFKTLSPFFWMTVIFHKDQSY